MKQAARIIAKAKLEHKPALKPKAVPVLIAYGYEPWPTFQHDGTWRRIDSDGHWQRIPVIYN